MGNIHVIIGEDDFIVAQAAMKIAGDGAGLEVVDSANSRNEEQQLADLRNAEESMLTPPFLEPRKTTWWKNVHFLPGGGKAKSGDEGEPTAQSVKAALEKFSKRLASTSLPDNQHFILSGPRLLQTSIFAKTLKASVEMAVFEKPKNATAAVAMAKPRAVEMAKEIGLSFSGSALDAFVSLVGPDTRSLMSELSKMRDYLGPGATKISEADVEAVSSPGVGVEPELWNVTDAVNARNLSKALEAMRRFEGEDGFSIFMTTVLEKCFRQMTELKDADERGEFAAATKSMNRWTADKIASGLSKWTLRELRVARKRMLDLRERAVTGTGGHDDAVFIEVVRALGGTKAGGRRQ